MNVTITVDGGCRNNGTDHAEMYGSARILWDRDLEHEAGAKHYTFNYGPGTNNQAEYFALLSALELLKGLGFESVDLAIHTDSALLANQITGRWRIKNATLRTLACEVRNMLGDAVLVSTYKFVQVPREQIVAVLGH